MMAAEGQLAPPRCILHIDMDAFYCAVEHRRLDVPRDKPLAVQQWSGFISVNYPAKQAGIKRGMTVNEALGLCPDLICVHVETAGGHGGEGPPDRSVAKVDLERYRDASREVFDVLEAAADSCAVEKAGLDEAYVDCTAACHSLLEASGGMPPSLPEGTRVAECCSPDVGDGPAVEGGDAALLLRAGCVVSQKLRDALRDVLQLEASSGIATNKVVAKHASALNKPAAQTLVLPAAQAALMAAVPLRAIRGLGGKLGARLEAVIAAHEAGEEQRPAGEGHEPRRMARRRESPWTGGDVLAVPAAVLEAALGRDAAAHVRALCRGEDADPVVPRGPPKGLMEMKSATLERSESEQWLDVLARRLAKRVRVDAARERRWPGRLVVSMGSASAMASRGVPFPPFHGGDADGHSKRVASAALSLVRGSSVPWTWPLTRVCVQATAFAAGAKDVKPIEAFFPPHCRGNGESLLPPPSPLSSRKRAEAVDQGDGPGSPGPPTDAKRRRQADDPPAAAEAEPEAQGHGRRAASCEWPCARCTFNCPAELDACPVCEASRAAPPEPDWPCERCTLVCPASVAACPVCGTVRRDA